MNRVKIDDALLLKHLESIASDGIDIFSLAGAQLRGAIVNATTLVNGMRYNHGLGILETSALGQGYIAALLSSMQLKGNDKLVLQIQCDGPMVGMSVEASAQGQVRGYLQVSEFPIQEPLSSWDLAPYMGNSFLTLIRRIESSREPVSGTTRMQYNDLAKDLALHFRDSEQMHTAFALGVWFDSRGIVAGAGGIMLQAMPGADPVLLEDLDDWLPTLPSLAKSLAHGTTGTSYLHSNFEAFEPKWLGSRSAEFFCACSREVFLEYLLSMEIGKRRELAESGPLPMKVLCNNCGSDYVYSMEEMQL